jgi:probable DNA metabolism protein
MAFLTQHPDVETLIYRKIRARIPLPGRGRAQVSLGLNIEIEKLARKVQREAHRMKGLVRFRQTGTDQYVALIAPGYDILPLIRTHFEARYADQNWIIYDTRRHYGLGFDRRRAHELKPAAADLITTAENRATRREKLCQRLWQHYYQAVNIAQRNNRRLHLRQLPRRYWRYLPEKKDARLHQKA